MNEEKKELMKKVALGTAAVGLIGVGYFIGKEVGFNIAKRNVGINLSNWFSSFPDEEALKLVESFDSYAKKCTINATGTLLPK